MAGAVKYNLTKITTTTQREAGTSSQQYSYGIAGSVLFTIALACSGLKFNFWIFTNQIIKFGIQAHKL